MVLGICVLLALAAVAEAGARTDNRRKPVVFVHGLALDGSSDCAATWNDVKRKFRDWGHTGGFTTVAYYGNDRNCSHWVSHHGSHRKHYFRYGHQLHGNHTADADIRHLGYHFAWFLWSHYSSAASASTSSLTRWAG